MISNEKPVVVENPVVVMKRYELKYIINSEQEAFFKEKIKGHMEPDAFGKTSIGTVYYDTPDSRLVNRSIEKPMFKEKLRLRSYGLATDDSPVFLELKRKAYGIVYKRRGQSTIPLVQKFLDGEGDICAGGQINREICILFSFFVLRHPLCLLSCRL